MDFYCYAQMNNEKEKRIYFHVGLGKIASKYLQSRVFPHLHGLEYIPSRKYYRIFTEIEKSTSDAILISREFDQQFESEVRKFAAAYPQTRAILFLRRQDSWLASQYRRFAKNGFTGSFSDFIDPVNDTGRFRMEDVNYTQKIKLLDALFEHPPLIMIYDDFIADTSSAIVKIAAYCNATIDISKIDFSRVHTSYNEKQIKCMQAVAKKIPVNNENLPKNRILFFLLRLPVLILRYCILYGALLVPKAWVNKAPLIPPEKLDTIRQLTANDWEYCLQRATK